MTKFINAMYWRVFVVYGFSLTIVNDQGNQMTFTL